MAAQTGTRMFTIDKFLGINESGDGSTELRMGEASKMENFLVTDAYNLTLRPGIQRVDFNMERTPAPILCAWAGFVGKEEMLVLCDFAEGVDRLFVYRKDKLGAYFLSYRQDGALGLTDAESAIVHIFTFNGELYVMSSGKTVIYDGDSFVEQEAYIPLVIAGADPAGGGTALENINLMSGKRRVTFSPDGTAKAFVLPEEAVSVVRILIDNIEYAVETAGSYDSLKHTFTFNSAPAKGVGNVEITYASDATTAEEARMQIIRCQLHEEYNGSTDTRIFMAGNGTNICYYSGVTDTGKATALYFPALNEVAVDMSGSNITGLIRHYSRLLVFNADSANTISYEPVTQTDGSTIAGFYLRPASREFGNEVMGQIQTVKNNPRTITRDGIYEWKINSSNYRDERNAYRISDKVERSLALADTQKIVTCDNDYEKTYYVFLNDDDGTVLVNRYELEKDGIWCVYKSDLCRNVRFAMVYGGSVVFVNDTEAFRFAEKNTHDASLVPGEASRQIKALWESGFMSFGADFRRKYSSIIYVSVKPQFKSEVVITAETDKRDDYMEKVIYNNVFSWTNANFKDWTFCVNDRPTINRVRLKVKKFVYYKLIFKIVSDGAQGTILGFDQQVRFASMAK